MNLKKIRKRTEYDAYKRSRAGSFAFLNQNYCEKGATVLAGDSITEGYTHTELFAEYTAETGIPVYNRGISGDTSDRLLERLEKTILNIKPKNLVLLIGTNDLGVGADADFALALPAPQHVLGGEDASLFRVEVVFVSQDRDDQCGKFTAVQDGVVPGICERMF